MKIKSASMVKFGLVMTAANLVGAAVFFLCHDKQHCIMFLVGTILWIGMVLVHNRNTEHEV